MGVYITIGILVVLIGGLIFIYNRLVSAKALVENGWSDMDVQLKRRADLIPQIVTTVKAYAAHEKSLFEDVTLKRNAALRAGDDRAGRGAAEGALGAPVSRLIAVAEDYPDLKANQNFLDLQNELSDTEDKIEMSRRFYNGAVRQLNIKVASFPVNMIAGLFGFRQALYFDMETMHVSDADTGFDT